MSDGGPAFPTAMHADGCTTKEGCVNHCSAASLENAQGMALRDWLAGTVPLTGMQQAVVDSAEQPREVEAKIRYDKADAMLKAREVTHG